MSSSDGITEKPLQLANLCTLCTSMTGSLEAWRQLASNQGFQHHIKRKLDISARRGCPICVMIAKDIPWKCKANEPLHLFLQGKEGTTSRSKDLIENGLPMFDRIWAISPQRPNKVMAIIHAFTTSGEPLCSLVFHCL
jgi:hypothetical protein